MWSDIVSLGVGSKSSLILFFCSQCRIVWSSGNSCCSTSKLRASHCGHSAALQPVRSSEAIDVRSFGQETCSPECRYARHQRVQLCLGDSNSVIACNRRSIAYTAFILTLLKTFFYMPCSKSCSRCKTWRNAAEIFTKQWLCLPHFVPLRFRHDPTHWLIIKFLQRHRAGSQRM